LEWNGTGSQTIPLGDLNTTGTVAGSGTIRLLNATASTTATFQVGALNLNSTYAGNIIANGTAITAITKVGAGTWTLTGANTYTGATTVNNGTLSLAATKTLSATSSISIASGATLSLAAASALNTPGATNGTANGVTGQVPITLGGGTLLRNGTGVSLGSQSGTAGTVGIGLLTLTAASTINYGTTGVGTLNFNGLAGVSGTNTLSVINYTTTEMPGTAGVDGTDDRLVFNQDVASFLPYISIDGSTPTELLLGNGEYELLAVPEPSTWAAVLIGLGSLAFYLRRKRSQAA
jgi:fibronectin-binding autotransporter adhesin